ncbi:hypothetical protein [Pectobacterium parvum]|uniref:hypothetical protein n=1 Tax=Pectobacterium parvum TaxID=2778550 RepID=UPI0021C5D59A|nr:hypothetical protein [Pectobacterium parvum]MCU1800264.1 hypothetical protein [Pectobacterium parvum]
MNITPCISQVPLSINGVEGINPADLSSKNIRGRDIIIINPTGEGGGDHALAKKIANIALDAGCRVTIYSLNLFSYGENAHNPKYQNYTLHNEEPHHISHLNDPLFIISPVGIAKTSILEKHLKKICEEFKFQKDDIILIEEMDLLDSNSQELNNYNDMLKKIGFTNISINKLGFDSGSIGYIPTDERTINEIKSRFEGELINLFDSYNVTLSRDNSYHLAYISSDTYVTGSQVFIANTLSEIVEDERSATFIMSLRELHTSRITVLTNGIENILKTKNEEFDYASLFSKATITVINSDSGNIERQNIFTGSGTKKIKIIITNKLPKNIYDDFLILADTGMASGDQSLSDYLTIKGKFPYYDMQPWKAPLVKSIKKLGGRDLEKHLDNRITGRKPFTGEIISSLKSNITQQTLTPEQLTKVNELDKIISSNTAEKYICELIKSRMKNIKSTGF